MGTLSDDADRFRSFPSWYCNRQTENQWIPSDDRVRFPMSTQSLFEISIFDAEMILDRISDECCTPNVNRPSLTIRLARMAIVCCPKLFTKRHSHAYFVDKFAAQIKIEKKCKFSISDASSVPFVASIKSKFVNSTFFPFFWWSRKWQTSEVVRWNFMCPIFMCMNSKMRKKNWHKNRSVNVCLPPVACVHKLIWIIFAMWWHVRYRNR